MVTIVDYKKRQKENGEEFYALIVQGGVEMIRSENTGKFYATAKKASIVSTFDELTCKSVIGTQLPGVVEKQECEPYSYTVESTGEEVELSHTYAYNPQEHATMEEAILGNELV